MTKFMRSLTAFVILSFVFGCALTDKATVYTEQGVRLAADQWNDDYNEQLDFCEESYAPKSADAERCFGAWYDADHRVGEAVRSIVALLRTYWVARAAGKRPDWTETAQQVMAIIDDLPPIAREYFDRVKGL